MSELEELIAQRKELDDKIKSLQKASTTCGNAKLDIDHFPTFRKDEWAVYIKTWSDVDENSRRWRSVIRSTDKQTVIDQIEPMINDLQGLLNKLRGE